MIKINKYCTSSKIYVRVWKRYFWFQYNTSVKNDPHIWKL